MTLEKRLFSVLGRGAPGKAKFCWQPGHGSHLCVAASDRTVRILDRSGRTVDQLNITGACIGLDWDQNGDVLALISDKDPSVILWEGGIGGSGKWRHLDSGLRDPFSVMIWSKHSSLLAVGTNKGNLMIFNYQTSRRIPIVGKHTRRVTCGTWNRRHHLALGSEDRTITLSNEHGDTLSTVTMKSEPSQLQFVSPSSDNSSDAAEESVSMVLSKRTFYIHNFSDPDNPVELAFQNIYGSIVQYEWYGSGYVLFGFDKGYFVVISTHIKEIGHELFQTKEFNSSLAGIAISRRLNKAASFGENIVKVHELQRLENVWAVISLDDERALEQVLWSDDGQLMAVGCVSGNVHVYISALPSLGAAYGTKVALLSSIMEITITDTSKKEEEIIIPIEIEPNFLAIGPNHLMVGMNTRAWIYSTSQRSENHGVMRDYEYVSSVKSALLNSDYAAVLCDGQLQLHMIDIDTGHPQERESRLFPGNVDRNSKITCHSLTQDFLIYGTDTGHVVHFSIEDWTTLHEFRHSVPLLDLQSNFSGTRLIFSDHQSEGFLFSPVTDQLERLPQFPSSPMGVIWDSYEYDRGVFIVRDKSTALTYVCTRYNIVDRLVECVGSTTLTEGQRPLVLNKGHLTLQTGAGKVVSMILSTHVMATENSDVHSLQTVVEKSIALKKYRAAWRAGCILNDQAQWRSLAAACLRDLDLELAIQVYRQIGDVASVWSLKEMSGVEDVKLLSGYVCSFLQQHDQAQTYFLASSEPEQALQMRCNLMHWEMAVQLASKLDNRQIAWVSQQHANQLENNGEFQQALQNYEAACSSNQPDCYSEEHKHLCNSGIARCSIRCGNIRKGMQIALNSDSTTLKKECAEIYDSMKQYNEAAILFEKAGYYDKAAQTLIKMKNWDKLALLLPNVQSLKIHSIYAKSREAEGRYSEAVTAYETAGETDNVVRLLLDKLAQPEKAVAVVRQTNSTEGARLVARFFLKVSDFASAIQFLIMSSCIEEAFMTAQSHEKMDLFADIIGNSGRTEDYRSIAVHYEYVGNFLQAGKFYHKAGQSQKAMSLLLRAATGVQEQESVLAAIKVVSDSNSDSLASQLINFLLGADEGLPKDPKYLFQLYMSREMYKEAAKTALIVSGQEQKAGSYRKARDMLFAMCQELRKQKLTIPRDMATNMMALHSYILARAYVKKNDHVLSARLLLRVSEHISKFPAHKVQILTSTVIECQRAGMGAAAFQQASLLLKDPELRKQVSDKYRRTVEGVVRRQQKEQTEQPHSPCPLCSHPLPSMKLDCNNCRRRLPFCLVTGVHITSDDLSHCQHCFFPALRSELCRLAENDEPCPLCDGKPLDMIGVDKDAAKFLPLMGEE